MTTQYGFDFGPLKVERTFGDARYGYGIHVTVGKRVLSIESSPHGRNLTVREHMGGNEWFEVESIPVTTKPSLVDEAVRPKWQLFTNTGEPTDWPSILAANEAWHRKGGRGRGTVRPDRAAVRGIVLTEAGRAYLAEMRDKG